MAEVAPLGLVRPAAGAERVALQLSPFSPWKLLRHAERVEQMLRGEVVYPVAVEFDLSNICNHGCPWCYYNGFRQEAWQHFPLERALTLLEELRELHVLAVTFTGGGEPLVHPHAAEIFRRVSALGFEWGLVTNGRRLEGEARAVVAEHATFCRVSLDAGRAQTHQLLHATALPEYERILTHIEALVRARRPAGPVVGASFCVFDVNVSEIVEAAQRVKATGADYVEYRPVFPTEWRGGGFANPLTAAHVSEARAQIAEARARYEDERFRIYGADQRFEQVAKVQKPYRQCYIGPLTTVINADGNVYHCCQQRGRPMFRVGSVLEHSFRALWLSEPHRRMMAGIDVRQCPPCRYDGYNEIIERACLTDGLHANFL